MKNIKIYSTVTCPYCVKAKNLLTQRGIPFEVVMIDDWSDDQWDELIQKSKMKTVPQIFADETLIGGYDSLAELDAKDGLAGLK